MVVFNSEWHLWDYAYWAYKQRMTTGDWFVQEVEDAVVELYDGALQDIKTLARIKK